MPSSAPQAFPFVAETMIALKPKSFLDVGCGMGLYGLAARIFGGLWSDEQMAPAETLSCMRVDAIEIFPETILPWHPTIYNHVNLGAAKDILPDMGHYDMIYEGDNLEHMTEADAADVLRMCWERADKLYMLAVPLDGTICQRHLHNSTHESHLSAWTPDKLAPHLPGTRIWYKSLFRQWVVWAWKCEPVRMRGDFGLNVL
jgi:hypothetical protein